MTNSIVCETVVYETQECMTDSNYGKQVSMRDICLQHCPLRWAGQSSNVSPDKLRRGGSAEMRNAKTG